MKAIFITTKGKRKYIDIELSKESAKELDNIKREICMGCPFGEDCLPSGECMIRLNKPQ